MAGFKIEEAMKIQSRAAGFKLARAAVRCARSWKRGDGNRHMAGPEEQAKKAANHLAWAAKYRAAAKLL